MFVNSVLFGIVITVDARSVEGKVPPGDRSPLLNSI